MEGLATRSLRGEKMPSIRQNLEQIQSSTDPDSLLASSSDQGLSDEMKAKLQKDGFEVYAGKVRELFRRGDSLSIHHSDRLTAFDCYIGMVPYKGAILAAISEFWLEKAGKKWPTHFKRKVSPRVLEVEACQPVKAEVVIRGYLAGSMLRAYSEGKRVFCGVELPDGLTPYCKLPKVIITPTTKAAAFEHDEETTPDELIKAGVATQDEWQQIAEMAHGLFLPVQAYPLFENDATCMKQKEAS